MEELILGLLKKEGSITVHDIAQATERELDEATRKSIQRILNKLIEKGVVKAQGAARSRRYLLAESLQKTYLNELFKGFNFTDNAQKLWDSVSLPVEKRKPIGFQESFLKNYKPNQTFYLSKKARSHLLSLGKTQDFIQPAQTYARHILNRLLIDLSWNSSRLEGNTYSLLETKRLIEQGEKVEGKGIIEAQMILNHKQAIEYIVRFEPKDKMSAHQIKSIHALLSENLLGDSGASGRLRTIIVSIGGTTYIPLENPFLLNENFEVFVKKLNQIQNPFEQSFFALVHLSYLQAFEDVNKRTSRIICNIPLAQNNLKPLSFTDVNQEVYVKSLLGIYEKNDVSLLHDLYVWAYERSTQKYSAIQQSMGQPNLLKIKYRALIKDIVKSVVSQKLHGSEASLFVQNLLSHAQILQNEKSSISQVIETEILNLHEGNIVQHQISLDDFNKWKKASFY